MRTQVQQEDHVQTQREDGHPQAKERGLRGSQPCRHLNPGCTASRTVRDHLSVVEGPQSVVLCFGIPSRLTQVPTIELAQKFVWVRP